MRFTTPAPLLPEIMALHGKWRGNTPAVMIDDRTVSWAEFTSDYHRFGHGLISRGINQGDRVGLLMSNSYEMLLAIFGAVSAGAVVVPLNVSVSDDAAINMLKDAGVAALVATEDLRQRLASIAGNLPSVRLKIAPSSSDDWLSISELSQGQLDTVPDVMLSSESLLNIIYSSGTTGLPKGIVHDHGGRLAWAYDLGLALRYHGAARTLMTIGLYSNISWVAMLATVLAGGCLVIERGFDEGRFIERVERDQITHTAMVPIQFQRVIAEAERRGGADFSSMHAMMSCGSPLRETLKRQIFQHFPCGIIELYGLTEGIITTLEPEDAEGRWSSVGRPLLGTDIVIVSDEDEVLPRGEAGEICSRARLAMPGYWQRPDADTDATFTDTEGVQWLRSGDIGYFDPDGYLYIVDRKKDMILSGGQNIYPQDIEAVLSQHEGVFDVAVIGISSAKWGETPVGLVVAKPGVNVDPSALKTWANERLGRQQRIAEVILESELPRNPNGKILKRELREQYKDRCYD